MSGGDKTLAAEIAALLAGHKVVGVADDRVIISVTVDSYLNVLALHAATGVAQALGGLIPGQFLGPVVDGARVAAKSWLASGAASNNLTLASKLREWMLEQVSPSQTMVAAEAAATARGWLPQDMRPVEVRHRIRNAMRRRSDIFNYRDGIMELSARGREGSVRKQAALAPARPPEPAPAPAEAPAPIAAPAQPVSQPPGGGLRPVRGKLLVRQRVLVDDMERVVSPNGQHSCSRRPGGGAHVWVERSPDQRKVGRCRHCGEQKAA